MECDCMEKGMCLWYQERQSLTPTFLIVMTLRVRRSLMASLAKFLAHVSMENNTRAIYIIVLRSTS